MCSKISMPCESTGLMDWYILIRPDNRRHRGWIGGLTAAGWRLYVCMYCTPLLLENPLDDAADSDSRSSASLSYAMLDSTCPSLPHPCPAFWVHAKASLARSWQPEREVWTNTFPFFIVFNDSWFRPFQLFHRYTAGCHFFLFSSIAKTNQSGPDDMIYMHPSQAATTSVTGMCLAWAVLYITNQ